MADGDDQAITDEGDVADAIPSAVDEKQQTEIKRRKLTYAAKRADFWRAVFADPVGRQEMWDIIGVSAHAFETKFACGPNGFPQTEATWAAYGEQMLGQRIFLSLQKLDFEGVFLMLCEHAEGFERPERASRGRK